MAGHDTPLRATLEGLFDLVRPRKKLELRDDERLDGRTVLITGGNRGLGFGIAELLARRGASLLLACRSGGPEAAAKLRGETGNQSPSRGHAGRRGQTARSLAEGEREVPRWPGGHNQQIEALPVDLAEHGSVTALVEAVVARGVTLDRLILNAGVVPLESRQTSAGFDVMFHVNFLAAVDLVEQLLARELIASSTDAPARIIVVASEAHRSGTPALDGFGHYEPYGTSGVMAHYGRNKLYLVAYAWALASALDPAKVGVFPMCPGAVASDLAREAPRWMKVLLDPTMRLLFQSPRVAAEPVAWLACARELDGITQRYYHMHTCKAPASWAIEPGNGEAVREAARGLLESL